MGEHLFSKASGTEMILYHDYVIWAGDLNFRLEEGIFDHSEASNTESSRSQLLFQGGEVGRGEQGGPAAGSRPVELGEEERGGLWRAPRDLAVIPSLL